MIGQHAPIRIDQFNYHQPTEHQLEILIQCRAAAKAHAAVLLELLPYSRCREEALMKLEEVSMWANKCCVFEVPPDRPGDVRTPLSPQQQTEF